MSVAGDVQRCAWPVSALEVAYHDEEWGVPVHDDARLFEMLTLEGAQAGLSWSTVLRKRARYREVFAGFDPRAVAAIGPSQVDALLADPGIIRHRGKVASTISNAAAVLAVQAECGSFDAYVWSFDDATALSTDLRRRGFRFVGPTIVYAFMQAAGLVNDHIATCFRHAALDAGNDRARRA